MTSKQSEFLRLVVAAGYCGCVTPSHHAKAWRVRVRVNGSGPLSFAQTVGDALVSQGYLIHDTTAAPSPEGGTTIKVYVPTAAAAEWVRKFPGRK